MSVPTLANLDQLRQLAEAEQLRTLLERDEDQWFDRVSSRIAGRALADLMIGFANAEGGLIAVGLWQGRVEGTRAAADRTNEWRQAARDFAEPPVRHRIEALNVHNESGQADTLLLVEVPPSTSVHVNRREEGFLRIGDENRKLHALELQELTYDKGQSVFDGTPVTEGDLDDLDRDLVASYLRRVRSRRSAAEALAARGLATKHRGHLVPTVAGILTLGATPERFFPEATIRLLRYEGSVREVGARANVADDIRIDGPLPKQVAEARRRLGRWLPSTIRLGTGGRFARRAEIPEFAWSEAIVNASIHRSYSVTGDHVRVELFADRLEVESPGRMPGLVRPQNIRNTRFARNPRLARAMADLGYGRELGEGVDRMFEEMDRVGLPEPVFTQGSSSVRVTLLVESIFARILRRLPRGSDRFVEHLSRVGRVTTTEAVALFAASRPTVLDRLRDLESARLIEHVGTSLKDPRGYWRVKQVRQEGA